MKKNEKGFMQEEKNLEKVAGGGMASGVEVKNDIKARDVNLKADLKANFLNMKNQMIKFNQNVSGDNSSADNYGNISN